MQLIAFGAQLRPVLLYSEGDRRKATAAALYLGAAAGLAHAADGYFGITQRLRPPTPEQATAAAAEAARREAEPYHGRAGE
jgi:hypothetical protein